MHPCSIPFPDSGWQLRVLEQKPCCLGFEDSRQQSCGFDHATGLLAMHMRYIRSQRPLK